MFAAAEFQDEKAYYEGELGRKVGTANSSRKTRGWRAGLAVYDISRGEAPREIGFMPIEGGGIHRLWYTGGRWAYASALSTASPTIFSSPSIALRSRRTFLRKVRLQKTESLCSQRGERR